MKKLKSLPEPLQKQILLRLGLAAALCLVGLISAIVWRDPSMLIIAAVSVLLAVLGIRIACREYIVIKGVCEDATATVIRKRTKMIVLRTEIDGKKIKLRISLRQQFRKIVVGDVLDVYVDTATQILGWDGEFRLQSYIAVDKRPAACYTDEVK